MKKIITWVLLLAMIVGLFAGCKKQDPTPVGDTPTVAQAMDYVKALYPNDPEPKKTPVDYERMGVVRINNVPFTVVWTTNLGEDQIKIVDNSDGTVTIDVNEQCEADTPYTLTATITGADGEKATHSWDYILPEAADMGEILKAAYALKSGESLPYESTLMGVVTVVKTPYDPSYKNITVIIEIAGYEDMPIECYRMKGEGIEEICIGDTITVTGTLKNYNGTIEFDAGCICERIVPGERVQAPEDMKQIVDEAYKLGANKSLPYEATLTGEIIEIGQPYDPSYKNITVTIAVEGREDKPIVCYRMKGENADKIGVNDIITVTGYITNYVGSKGHSTIEYTAGCQLVAWEDKAGPVVPNTMQEIVDEAYALGANEKLKYEATLTGVITKVKTAYDAGYDNVSVEIVVDGREDKPILAYRMKGNGASIIDIGDTITVKGYITNYVGDAGYSTIEFLAGCQLLSYKKNPNVAPTDPVKIVEAAYALEPNKQLPYKVTLTGVITRVKTPYDSNYNNVTVIIEVPGTTDMPVTCYRMKGTGADKIAVGDTITVVGYIVNYQHSSGDTEVEFEAGCKLDSWVAGSERPEEPEVPSAPKAPYVEEVVTGTAYKFGMYQNDASVKKNLYFTGALSGNYLATSANSDDAVDVYLESAGSGKYYLYFMKDNVKTYIAMEEFMASGKNYYNAKAVFSTEVPSVYYTWNDTLKTIVCNTGSETFCFGTHGTYTTISCSSSYYYTGDNAANVDVTQYIGRFYNAADIPEYEEPEIEPTEPEVPVANEIKLTVNSLGMTANSYSTSAATVNGVDFEWFELGYFENGIQMRTKNGNSLLWNTSAFSAPIKEIRLVCNSGKKVYDNPDAQIYSFGNAEGEFTHTTTLTTVADTYEYVITPDAETYTYFELEHTLGFTLYFDSITIVLVDDGADEPEATEPEETEPIEPAGPAYPEDMTIVTAPAADTAYKLGLLQNNLGKTLYFAGTTANYPRFFTTTEDVAAATDVFVEEVTGGYRMFFMDGETKTYIDIAPVDTYINAGLTTEPSAVYTMDTTYNTLVANVSGTDYYLGAYGTYNTIGASKLSYAATSFPANLLQVATETPDPEPTEPETEPTEPAGPAYPEDMTIVTAPAADTAYKLGLLQNNLGKTLYFAGTTANYPRFFTTTEDVAAATDVFVEEVTGGYRMFFMDGETKTYIDIAPVDTYINAGLTTEPSAVYTMDTTYNTLVANVSGTDYYLGAYGTYNTIGASKLSYAATSFPANLLQIETEDDVLTIEEAIAMGTAMEHNTYTTDKYYVTGVITNVYNTMYGNMYITDEAGNQLKIYGTYSADGTIRYDGMDVKPVVGDTVTIYGVIGQYNGEAQIKDGWITEHIPGEGGTTDPDPTDPPAVEPEEPESTELKAGDKVVIYCPAYNKALSSTKTGYYNVGVDVTVNGGVVTGYEETEIWTVGVNPDGTYTFAYGGQNIGISEGFSSMAMGVADDDWAVVALGDGLYTIQNVTRSNYLEWYDSKGNWSTYNKSTAASDPLFQMSFYIVEAAE